MHLLLGSEQNRITGETELTMVVQINAIKWHAPVSHLETYLMA